MGNPFDAPQQDNTNPFDAAGENPFDKQDISLNGPIGFANKTNKALEQLLGEPSPENAFSGGLPGVSTYEAVKSFGRVATKAIVGADAKLVETASQLLHPSTYPKIGKALYSMVKEAPGAVVNFFKDKTPEELKNLTIPTPFGNIPYGIAKPAYDDYKAAVGLFNGLVAPFTTTVISSASGYNFAPVVPKLLLGPNNDDVEKQYGELLNPLSEAQRVKLGEEATVNYVGAAIGTMVGKSTRYGTGVKNLEELTNVKSWGQLPESLAALDPYTRAEVANLMKTATVVPRLVKGAVEGSTFGFIAGSSEGDTPDERFNNALHLAFAGALIGSTLEGVLGARPSPKIKSSIDALNLRDNYFSLMNLPAKNAAKAAAELADGIPIDQVILRNMPRKDNRIITELPNVTVKEGNLHEYSLNKENSFEIAIKNKEVLTEDIYNPSVLDDSGNPKILAKAGEIVTPKLANKIINAGIERISTTEGFRYFSPIPAVDASVPFIFKDPKTGKYSVLFSRPEGILTHHGTGAEFDKFDTSFLGTGEGSQAFGWGIYTAEHKGVAEYYVNVANKNSLVGKKLRVQLLAKSEELLHYDLPISKQPPAVQAAIIKLAEQYQVPLDMNQPGSFFYHELASAVDDIATRKAEGLETVYEILSKRPNTTDAELTDAITKLGLQDYAPLIMDRNIDKLGDVIENLNTKVLGKYKRTDEAASMLLSDLGVKGIKFKDNFSRSTLANEAATHNYVIFNGDNLNIVDKNAPVVQLPPEVIKSFKEHGFIPKELVIYKGKEHSFVTSTGDRVILQSLEDGKQVNAPRTQVKHAPNLERVWYDGGIVYHEDMYGQSTRAPVGVDPRQLSEDELGTFKKNQASVREAQEKESLSVASRLAAGGLSAERVSGGRMMVYNRTTGQVIGVYDNLEKLSEALPDYTDAFSIGGSTLLPPAKGNPRTFGESLASDTHSSITRRFADYVRLLTYPIHHTVTLARALGNLNPSSDIAGAILEHQRAGLKFNAARMPWLKKVEDLAKGLLKGMDSADRSDIFHALEASTPEEFIANGLSRRLTDTEVSIARDFAEKFKTQNNGDASLKRVADYRLNRAIWGKKFTGQKLQNKLAKWETEVGPLTNDERDFLNILDANKAPLSEFSEYGVQELARKILLDTPSRNDFMKDFTPAKRAAVAQIEQMFKDLAKEFGIPEARRITNYISHFRRYNDQVNLKGTPLYAELDGTSRSFVNDLTRIGNITDFNTDPIDILLRYINSGFADRHLAPSETRIRREVKLLADSYAQNSEKPRFAKLASKGIKTYFDNYLDAQRGDIADAEAIAEASMRAYLKAKLPEMPEQKQISFIRAFVAKWNPFTTKNFLRGVETSAQGARFTAGGRDLFTGLQMAELAMGNKALLRGMTHFSDIATGSNLLVEMGRIPGRVTSVFNETLQEQIARESMEAALGHVGLAGHIYDKVTDLAFALSLQPTVYEKMHALVYWGIAPNALDNIGKLVAGKVSRAEFEKAIELDKYDPSIVREFNKQLNSHKYKEAADVLALDMGYRVVGMYGKANAPRFMWNRFGKLAGQFGQWPIWLLNGITDEATRSPKGLAKAVAITGASYAAMEAAKKATGFNLSSWALTPMNALNQWFGPDYQDNKSPALQLAINAGQALMGAGKIAYGAASGQEVDATNFADAMNDIAAMVDPSSGILVPIPLMLRQNGREVLAAIDAGYPPEVIGWMIMGGNADPNQYPKILDKTMLPKATPTDEFPYVELSSKKLDVNKPHEVKALFAAAVAKPSKELVNAVTVAKMAAFVPLVGMLRGKVGKVGLELEFSRYHPNNFAESGFLKTSERGLLKTYYDKFLTDIHDPGDLYDYPRYRLIAQGNALRAKSGNPEFILKGEVGEAVELTYGPAEIDKLDLDGLRQRLDFLKEYTVVVPDKKIVKLVNGYYGSGPPTFGIGAMHIHVSPKPDLNGYYGDPKVNPFKLPPEYISYDVGVRPGKTGKTIEYRDMLSTYDIDEIVSRLNIAFEHTMKLIKKYGEYKAPRTREENFNPIPMDEASGP
jgi:hypothetical protein